MEAVEVSDSEFSITTWFKDWFGGEDATGFILKMLFPVLFIFVIGILFPLIYGIITSTYFYQSATNREYVAIGNYISMFQDDAFWNSYWNTMLFVAVTVTFELIFGLAIALLLNKRFKGRGLIRAAVLVPWALPTIVNARIWEYIFRADELGPVNDIGFRLGLLGDDYPSAWVNGSNFVTINVVRILLMFVFIITAMSLIYSLYTKASDPRYKVTYFENRGEIINGTLFFVSLVLVVILPRRVWTDGALSFSASTMLTDWYVVWIVDIWKTTPFMALLILAGLQVIPKDLMDAAEVDGANSWQKFKHVTFPLLLPSLGIALLFRIIDAFRVYDIFAIFVAKSIEPITKFAVRMHRGGRYGMSSAIAIVEFINIVFFTIIIMSLTRRRVE